MRKIAISREELNISRISDNIIRSPEVSHYSVCWFKDEVISFEIDGKIMNETSNSIFFLDPKYKWKISKKADLHSVGYILFIPRTMLDNPLLSKLHINEVRLFSENEIPKIKLTPGIEKRVQDILEMLDELIGSELNHKEDAIISLLNALFVYCDGKCNIKSVAFQNSTKKSIVYKFKKFLDTRYNEYHEVDEYARLLNITPGYLNECVNEVLKISAKSVIIEHLVLKARHALKFTDKSAKEISYELGFSSSDYFSYFIKKNTGVSPSGLRNSSSNKT